MKNLISKIYIKLYTYKFIHRSANIYAKKVHIKPHLSSRGMQHISIGDKCYIGPNCRIEAWDEYNGEKFNPKIEIKADVRINSTCHIGSINRITIGEECLLGSHVTIIDHSHGHNTLDELSIHPSDRNLYSKGPINIGARCWICENATILPNVTIGEGTIIGANAVVTSDIPAYCVAVGNPAKVVKIIR